MRGDELEIFNHIETYFAEGNKEKDNQKPLSAYNIHIYEALVKQLESLLDQGIGKRSHEFIAYIKEHIFIDDRYIHLLLWLDIEEYLQNKSPEKFAQMTSRILKINEKCSMATGEGSLPDYITNGLLLRNVYLQSNEQVITLFKRLLPLPPVKFFEGHELPKCIADHEKEKQACLDAFTNNNKGNLSQAVDAVIKIQRFIRGKQRQREEVQRIKNRYKSDVHVLRTYFKGDFRDEITDFSARAIIADASTPYIPEECSKELADRIMNAVKDIELFSTIQTITATNAIDKIFDTAFFGRRTLERQFIPFRPATLQHEDIENGDGNAICFGPNKIDTKLNRDNSTVITLDLRKLIEQNRKAPNPCIFFKQRDFGYQVNGVRSVYAKDAEIPFTHTGGWFASKSGFTYLQMLTGFNESGNPKLEHFSGLPHYHFIAYDLENIHQILTCNFFRLLDTLKDTALNDAPHEARRIYNLISELSNEELVQFLTTLGKHMTDTCEFNFYGAYRIDFDLIVTIRNIVISRSFYSPDYVINLPEFIDELQKGHAEKFTEAEKEMPTVFKSSRFMAYLLSKVDHPASRDVLLQHCGATVEMDESGMRCRGQ